ncbi:MAG: arabinosyltransferase [Gordonia sp.]|uniref:arabinosyltransferase domain-containing protein n=1 Tax=Gordonia sp. (in: high G+C Gram-positive bacteria) TaxID=84139 RepID=UPI000C4578E8|nr:arabinosyltransferase domain-containing protein [Gordonia sp. (in: high G+C Gram-positive bacteria)]MAU83793.1 arabinosyltransferase [Gordonia sp. (in: high G+C Gram-positive bacteria)]
MTDTPTTDAPSTGTRAPRIDHRTARIVAVVAGLLGFLMALVTPLLPVNQSTAELNWPQGEQVGDVAAPLVSYVPIDMDVTVPCALASDLPDTGGMLLSTIPAGGQDAAARALMIRATQDALLVTDRDVVILNTPRAAAQANPNCRIVFHADGDGVNARIDNVTGDGQHTFSVPDHELRPQIVGVYTDLPATASREGLSLHATIDTRYVSTPAPLKVAVIVLGILMTILSLIALGILDRADGRSHKRFLPSGWWTIRGPDIAVFAILAFWWIGGANTSDDGYNFTVGRIAGEAGYADNYFRYFGVPQDPFGWHFQVISAMTHVSLAAPWMRLPAFLLGLLGWWLISREVIPRLGRAVRNSTPAVWSAAFVFLAIWLPYNNGLRPEPAEAVGALLTWCCVERAIATRRLLPYAVAVVTAAFTLALAPGGLMAVAALLAGIRPVIKTLVTRRRRDGLLAMIAPILAAGTAVLYQIFFDQPLAPLIAGNKVASDVGPTLEWWSEPVRYYYLILPTADGTLARRFGVLIMILCLVVVLLRLLRREHPNGVARAPIWRLIAVTLGTMFFIAFTPTKWTHHFGVYAGIAGGLAAAAGAMMAPAILRSRRNRTFFAAAVLAVTAISFTGTNGWWFVGSFGVPWWDRPPSIAGIKVGWAILVIAVVTALVGLWYHFRDDYVDEQTRTRGGSGWLSKLKFSPLPVISAFMVIFMVLSFVKGAYEQRDSWSWLKSNARALTGNECALANDVLVEADPNTGLLLPAAVDGRAAPDISAALAGSTNPPGFTPNGVPNRLSIDSTEDADTATTSAQNTAQTGAGADESTETSESAQGGTEGGQGVRGVNGSTVSLPFGLNPANTPVLGSYGSPTGTGSLTTDWYQLPARSADAPLLTIAAAGSVEAVDGLGVVHSGQQVNVQFGRTEADGSVTPVGMMTPIDIGEVPIWRNLRYPLADAPPRADVVRVEVRDTAGAPSEWVAITPPRVTTLQTLNDVVGTTDPVFIDWLPGFVFPCQQPMAVSDGVLEVPQWRIMPDAEATRKNSQTWMSGKAGGPLGITEAMLKPTLLPTYLRNNWGRDWGGLQRFTEIAPAPPAELDLGTARRSALYDPAPMRSSGY